MSDVVIRAEGLGKRYLIGHETERERYVALRDVIARSARNFVRSAGDMMRGRQLVVGNEIEEFWALKDVDFEIRRGEVVGIIGRNGAGKSTLLKILSRITEPTTGRVEIRGRVASLLEVGTGFHPELTGRENIFLNGAILGMSRAEIKRKFDEIVAFAEVEKFLDTPVKRYSSGMYVRLAFAVAAHLEPEILIVDEVLAVGDAEFQKKCLGKMKDVAGGGRTVLFVSHNMGAVQQLCSKCILLARGAVRAIGAAEKILHQYSATATARSSFSASRASKLSASVYEASASVVETQSGNLTIVVQANVLAARAQQVSIDVRVKTASGSPVGFATASQLDPSKSIALGAGDNKVELAIDGSTLCNGDYLLSIDVGRPKIEFIQRIEDCLSLAVRRETQVIGQRRPMQAWGVGSVCLPVEVTAIALDASQIEGRRRMVAHDETSKTSPD